MDCPQNLNSLKINLKMLKNDLVLATAFQRSLVFAALEDFSTVDVLGNIRGGQFGECPSAWEKQATEFIYLNLKAGLIQIKNAYDIVPPDITAEGLRNLLASTNPEVNVILWMGLQFTATDALVRLVDGAGLLGWGAINSELNTEFIQGIDLIYLGAIQ